MMTKEEQMIASDRQIGQRRSRAWLSAGRQGGNRPGGGTFPVRFCLPLVIAGLSILSPYSAAATAELVYRPVNPAFGGNPFATDHLLAVADRQNKYTAPSSSSSDPTDRFINSLQSRLLSGLASQVTEAIFGDDPQDSGSFTVGDQRVTFERGLETIQIAIFNDADGTETVIEVPAVNVE
jgi:curli production assembly/transport component CsgF